MWFSSILVEVLCKLVGPEERHCVSSGLRGSRWSKAWTPPLTGSPRAPCPAAWTRGAGSFQGRSHGPSWPHQKSAPGSERAPSVRRGGEHVQVRVSAVIAVDNLGRRAISCSRHVHAVVRLTLVDRSSVLLARRIVMKF